MQAFECRLFVPTAFGIMLQISRHNKDELWETGSLLVFGVSCTVSQFGHLKLKSQGSEEVDVFLSGRLPECMYV